MLLKELVEPTKNKSDQDQKRMTGAEKKALFDSMPKPMGFPKKAEGPWLEFVEV
jgi:hypothetical protein